MANKKGSDRRVWVCTVCGHKQDVHPDTQRKQCSICKKYLMVPGSFDALDQTARLDVLRLTQRVDKLDSEIKMLTEAVETILKVVRK